MVGDRLVAAVKVDGVDFVDDMDLALLSQPSEGMAPTLFAADKVGSLWSQTRNRSDSIHPRLAAGMQVRPRRIRPITRKSGA